MIELYDVSNPQNKKADFVEHWISGDFHAVVSLFLYIRKFIFVALYRVFNFKETGL